MAFESRLPTAWRRASSSPSTVSGSAGHSLSTRIARASAAGRWARLDSSSTSRTSSGESSSGFSDDSRRDSDRRSVTRLDIRSAWRPILARKRWRSSASISGSSISVSTSPRIAVTGVLSSCETLATKSRRTVSRRRSRVTSWSTRTAPPRVPPAALSGDECRSRKRSVVSGSRATRCSTSSLRRVSASISVASRIRVTSQIGRPCASSGSAPSNRPATSFM